MTTIHTIQDLLRVLDENPEWVEELRQRLLSRELLELPERFARFSEFATQKFEEHDRQFTTFTEFVTQKFEENDRQFTAFTEFVAQKFEENDGRFERIERRLDTIQNDLGPIKGRYARNITHEQADGLAYHMGLFITAKVTQRELIGMIRNNDTAGIPQNDITSFINADLVFRATDNDGKEQYVAVEASHTANGRDTYRAIRNAEYLTRFTGLDATAVVSAARIDNRINEAVASGQVYWYQIDESKFFHAA